MPVKITNNEGELLSQIVEYSNRTISASISTATGIVAPVEIYIKGENIKKLLDSNEIDKLKIDIDFKKIMQKQCVECGADFMPVSRYQRQRFCSDSCRIAYNSKKRRKKPKKT